MIITGVELPVIKFAFGDRTPETAVSEHTIDEVHAATNTILKPFGLKSSREFTRLALEVYPYLSLKLTAYINAFHIYLWLLDDIVDEPDTPLQIKEQLLSESLISLADPVAAIQPICKLGTHLLSNITNGQMRSYVMDKMELYYRAVREHISGTGTILTMEEYFKIRLNDGAVYAVLPFCFSDMEDFAPYYQYLNSDTGKRALKLTNLNICYVNDLHSYQKDIREGCNFNMVFCHQAQYQTTITESIKILVEECNDHYRELTNIQDELKVTQRLLLWCEGSARWHAEAERYRLPKAAAPEQ